VGITLGVSALLMSIAVTAEALPAKGRPQESVIGHTMSTDAAASTPISTSFTYQGQLKDSGGPVNDNCEMAFRLYGQASGGTQVGTAIPTTVPISDGLFAVSLDFGEVFTGTARWMEIAVQCPGDADFTTLSPRQALTPVPYALALPGLWTQQNGTSPNLIGGYGGNSVAPGVVGATIGGGGSSGEINQVTGNYGTVGGGYGNTAAFTGTTIGGGRGNTTTWDYATVGGGYGNTATGSATVAGGYDNAASAWASTVGGGVDNTARWYYATVAGGQNNIASGTYGATVGGGHTNEASSSFAIIAGGQNNTASGNHATVGGGLTNAASFPYTSVSGGRSNTAGGNYATVGGGHMNHADALTATIGGGEYISVTGEAATVAGGSWITATGDYAAAGGGGHNTASGWFATVSGGYGNAASNTDATVGGGRFNAASSLGATVGGGQDNTSGYLATVGGGQDNTASGSHATIPGGLDNTAVGNYSFAAGRRAKANNTGAFVWADSSNYDFASTTADQFSVRATGGARFVLDINTFGFPTWTCSVSSGGSWACSSDRNLKEHLVLADGSDVLERLSHMPIYYWNAKGQATPHIGPMAQDFYAAYGVGDSDTAISTIDLDGVALAAIQGLYTQNQALQQENNSLQVQVSDLQQQNADFEARLAALEQGTISSSQTRAFRWLPSGLVTVAAVAVVVWYRGRRLPREGGQR
jgi:hypothetical protein